MVLRSMQEGFNPLWFQDIQSAVDIKGATSREWSEIQHQKRIFLEKSGARGFKDVLLKFQIRVRGVLTKCKTTQGVLKKKAERVEKAAEGAKIQTESSVELENIRRQSRIMAEVIVDIGKVFQAVTAQIDQISDELISSRTTLSGQAIGRFSTRGLTKFPKD